MTPDALAALHGRCFTQPRPWTATELAGLLDSPHSFLLTRAPDAMLLGRAIAGEAELLTLAVAPEARRQGLASALLAEFAAASRAREAETAFLEVASDNAAALALYRRHGWAGAGLRRDYYAPGIDALVLRLAL
ncbi:GNAT family N-acetyltransferase [Paracoccus sp. M683]|uniref:GNAT family N-acetyltransferase n=1 Tax=Paracoccus sp. M683 TaxID=2594268 RepID=UPI00117D1F77|nr:GNAT family N-acetyltransferase [Paracoccus sp. M683]TRW95465.1 GNAT family N-acetyltransferase [Paracoccus sp. M683]